MLLLLIFCPSYVRAYDFDTLLYDCISEQGLYTDKGGIIYTATIENDTMLAVISADDGIFSINIFGSENEPADVLTVDYNSKKHCRISITDSADDFCITVQNNKQYDYYRLINDAFTVTHTKPDAAEAVAEYRNGKLKIFTKPSEIYSLINSVRLERVNHIPYEASDISETDRTLLLRLLRACADIYEYDENTAVDELMRKVLYTHKNFTHLTSVPPESSEKNPSLKLCSEKYITSAVYNAFRRESDRPAVNMLTETGYCYNNGYYYYTGGYTDYFRTEVHDIIKAYKMNNNSLYLVFSDTYTENDTTVSEYSSAVVQKDKDGYYLTSLKMGDDFRNMTVPENTTQTEADSVSEALKSALPFIIMLFTLAAVGIVIYFYIIRI